MEPTANRRSNLRWVCLFATLALPGAGCFAFTPAGPVGPLRPGNTTQMEIAWGLAYGPATATVGNVAVKGNGQAQAAGGDTSQIPDPLPVRVGVRQSLGDGFEASVDIGVVDSGLRLRVGLPSGPLAPSDLAIELRDGQVSASPKASYQGSFVFEIYPTFTPDDPASSRRLILSLGIVGGVFEHQLSLPFSFEPDFDLPLGGPSMTVLRPELRLQTAVGAYLGGGGSGSGGVSIAVAPWILLGARTPTSFTCNSCTSNPALASFSQTWGASLIITPSIGWLHAH
jgi:hypothetical protein